MRFDERIHRIALPRLVVFSAAVSCIQSFIFSVTARDSVERSRFRSAMSATRASIA
jgi:hypothetical protein